MRCASEAPSGRKFYAERQERHQQQAIQSLLAKVFLSVQTPVAIVSEDGIIHMANPALEQMLGCKPGSLTGRVSMDYIAADCREAVAAARQNQMAHGSDFTLATRLLRADGKQVAVDITSTVAQRENLKRFRIVTILKRSEEAPMTVQVAAKIRLIGLDAVRQTLGSRWHEVASKAMAIAELVVRSTCGPRDTSARTEDSGFLICFADASEEEASFRAAALAHNIRARLIGEGETEAATIVSAITAQVDVPRLAGRSPDALTTIVDQRLNARRPSIEARARVTLREAAREIRCKLDPVYLASSMDVIGHFARLPDRLGKQLLAAQAALPMQERQGFDLDRLVLDLAANEVDLEIAPDAPILVNVDFEVLLDQHRTERYVSDLSTLDEALRERLILVLSGLPKGVPRSRVLDFVMCLSPHCRSVAYQCSAIEMPPVDGSVLHDAIGVFQGLHVLTNPDEADRFASLVGVLHAHQARVLVRQVAQKAVGPLALLGVDLVTLAEDERDRGADWTK